MAKLEIMNNATRAFHKIGLKIKKHSPEILVVAGVAGTVAGTVMACKATLKVDAIVDESKEKIERINTATEKGKTEAGEDYTADDSTKDKTIVYTQTAVQLAKLYAPAVVVGGVSIAAILTGHNLLRKRNMALAAAYATIDKSFKEYRGRVVERFGKELDRELRYNIKAKEIEETVVNEDGTESTVKKTVDAVDPNEISGYARIFEAGCKGHTKDPQLNMVFLKQTQAYLNDLLQKRGYVFLNEVYEALGFDRTADGQVVGWIYDEETPNGDNFIDLGLYNIANPATRRFVNGWEYNVLIDPNVDGYILDLI